MVVPSSGGATTPGSKSLQAPQGWGDRALRQRPKGDALLRLERAPPWNNLALLPNAAVGISQRFLNV